MSLRRCESPGVIAQIAALSVDHAPTAIIRCPYTSRHHRYLRISAEDRSRRDWLYPIAHPADSFVVLGAPRPDTSRLRRSKIATKMRPAKLSAWRAGSRMFGYALT
jgi:hypothetical protein